MWTEDKNGHRPVLDFRPFCPTKVFHNSGKDTEEENYNARAEWFDEGFPSMLCKLIVRKVFCHEKEHLSLND